MFLLVAYLFLFRQPGTIAAPIYTASLVPDYYNTSTLLPDGSAPACRGRTVLDIVWSCLATTIAVTWVSVHPNIPRLNEDRWSILRRRLFLMCFALLAPEALFMWAFKQWRGAVMIKEAVNKARPNSDCPWTMTHAHFLQMGGFRLCTTEKEDNRWQNIYYGHQRNIDGIAVWEGVFSFYSFTAMLHEGKIDFPEVRSEEINDRSKGDALSKGVALLQVVWFIVQLIARHHQNLTITEIELATAALAGINSIMYLCWWSKPLDVRFPIVIRTKKLESLLVDKRKSEAATEAVSRRRDGGQLEMFPQVFDKRGRIFDDFQLSFYPMTIQTLQQCVKRVWSLIAAFLCRMILDLTVIFYWRHLLNRIHIFFGLCFRKDRSSEAPSVPRLALKCIFLLPYLLVYLPMKQILDPGVPRTFKTLPFQDANHKMHLKPVLQMLFEKSDMKWVMEAIFNSQDVKMKPLLCFAVIVGAAFGSIHCTAWHFTFPSHVHQVFWRTASSSIVGVCLSVIVGIPLHDFAHRRYKKAESLTNAERCWFIARGLLRATPVFIFSVSRLSLLFLSLLALHNLPNSALETVTWSTLIPHI